METNTRQLQQSEWRPYFDRVSRKLGASKVDVLLLGLDLGVQSEAEKLSLLGITYDHHDDALDISAEGLEHRILGPESIFVQEDVNGRLVSCKVRDAEGHEQILQIEPALMLAAS